MKKIYTGIELGTNNIKIVVAEKINDKFHVLASTSNSSMGIKNGEIIDTKTAVSSVKNSLREINDMLGLRVNKAVVCISPKYCNLDIVNGSADIIDYNEITGEDVSNVLVDAIGDFDFQDNELVTAIPISFGIDEKKNIADPKGMKGSVLFSKVVIGTTPKEPLYRVLEVLRLSGIETVDICFTSTGDYFCIKNRQFDNNVGAIINIGEETTNVSIFNKGIQIKNSVLPIGSLNVDKDISYVFKIDMIEARKIKEGFCLAKASYADSTDVYEVVSSDGEVKEINQRTVSKVVEARVKELLKIAKSEIKNLTNREIRYIIITGGISEMSGFQYLIDEEFGFVAKVCNIPLIGIRHNKFSSCLGTIKYFDDKLTLRGKTYNMFNDDDFNDLLNTQHKMSMNDNILSKVFGHFFDS